MGMPAVVVRGVYVKHVPQVPLAEDEHAIGDLGAGGEHEPFGVRVGSGISRWDLGPGDSGIGGILARSRMRRIVEVAGRARPGWSVTAARSPPGHQPLARLRRLPVWTRPVGGQRSHDPAVETRESGASHREHRMPATRRQRTLHRPTAIDDDQPIVTCGFGSELGSVSTAPYRAAEAPVACAQYRSP